MSAKRSGARGKKGEGLPRNRYNCEHVVKPKVLVSGLSNCLGGTEVVVKNYVSVLEGEFDFDYLATARLDRLDFVHEGNSTVYVAPDIKTPYTREIWLRDFFKRRGSEYAAIWANFNHLLYCDVLLHAKKSHVPVRLAHAHNARFLGTPLVRVFSGIVRHMTKGWSTKAVACSEMAGKFFWGNEFTVVPNAFALEGFAYSEIVRRDVRRELGLSDESLVVGTVGRLTVQKNHCFLLEIMPELLSRVPSAHLVIVGAGICEAALKAKANSLGIAGAMTILGERGDVNRVLSAFDVFAFPSLFEGLGISLVEAQINGLPCVASSSIPDTAIISDYAVRIDLKHREKWVSALTELHRPNKLHVDSSMYDINLQSQRMRDILTGIEKSHAE